MRSILGWLVLALVGCATPKFAVGPFPPDHPKVCGGDPQCPDHSACRYPAASSRQAVCMSGRESDVYGWSPSGE